MCPKTARAFALTFTIVPAFTSSAIAHPRLAPADEYFGRLKMSILEITNRIKDAERGSSSFPRLRMTQDAIEDWTRKYPGDPWIPTREERMWRLFSEEHSSSGNAEAAHCRSFMHTHFPHLRFLVP